MAKTRAHPRGLDATQAQCGAHTVAWEALLRHATSGDVESPEEDTIAATGVVGLTMALDRAHLSIAWAWFITWGFQEDVLVVVLSYFTFCRPLRING